MKKYYIGGIIILFGGLMINYKLRGFKTLNPKMVKVSNYKIYGIPFEGSYKSDSLSTLVQKMRELQKKEKAKSNVVIINYIDKTKETLGIVSNFVGITSINKDSGLHKILEKRIIKANKAIRITVKIKPLVMPPPEKIKKLAFDFAKSNGIKLQNLSVEKYSKEGVLIIDFPIK
jgi:hypothetical protein